MCIYRMYECIFSIRVLLPVSWHAIKLNYKNFVTIRLIKGLISKHFSEALYTDFLDHNTEEELLSNIFYKDVEFLNRF